MATDPTTDDTGASRPLVVLDRDRVDPPWITVGAPGDRVHEERPLGARRVVLQLVVGIVLVLTVVTVGGSFAARRLAEREAVRDAAAMADVLAENVVQPALTDRLVAGDVRARARFDRLVRERVLGDSVVRVKIWSPQGRVLYADEPELIGRTFELDPPQRAVLSSPRTEAEISDLDRDENTLDRSVGDKLVEVYRPVWTAGGREVLFEIYTPYDAVSRRTGQLWRGFAGVTLSSLLLFVVLLAPLLWHLVSRVRRAQRQREQLLLRAVDASTAERRRIGAHLHDGPVQDLAAASFVVAGASARAGATGRADLATELDAVSDSVRTSIRALRSLLVDIYPPSLSRAGLVAALGDLVQTVRAPGLEVRLAPGPADALRLLPDQERLVYRVAQETLRNAAKHAAPCSAVLSLRAESSTVLLDVVDDGPGFDVQRVLSRAATGHFGLRLMADLVAEEGALLEVASAPGHGTHWRLRVDGAGAGGRR